MCKQAVLGNYPSLAKEALQLLEMYNSNKRRPGGRTMFWPAHKKSKLA